MSANQIQTAPSDDDVVATAAVVVDGDRVWITLQGDLSCEQVPMMIRALADFELELRRQAKGPQ